MNLLVGGTGFIGGHLVEYLFQQGEISKGVFRKGSHLKIMDLNGVQGIEADLTDHHALHEAMEGADVVYNLASPMPGEGQEFLKANTEGVLNLLEVASEAKAKAFVHLSTLDVYGFSAKLVGPSTPLQPTGDYQRAKAEAERLLQEFASRSGAPRVAIIRAAMAVGSRDESFVVPFLKMVDRGRAVLPQGGVTSFSHPRDIAKAMYGAAMGSTKTGEVYLTKSFDASADEIVRTTASLLAKEVQVKKEGVFSGSLFPKYTTERLRASLRIDDQPSWREIGYAPDYTLKSACEEIAAWYRKEPWVTESA